MSVHNSNRFHTAEPWAHPSPITRNLDSNRHTSAEFYVFGSLVVIWFADNRIKLVIADCVPDAWANRRGA